MSPKKASSKESTKAKLPKQNERLLDLERELQLVKLELDEHRQLLKVARQDLELHARQSEEAVAREVRGRIEKLFQEIAGSATQLVTQDHMLSVQNKPLKATDIQAVANRLIQTLQNHGLVIQGKIGDTAVFDKNLHQPLSSDEDIKDGEEVIVRMSGISNHAPTSRQL